MAEQTTLLKDPSSRWGTFFLIALILLISGATFYFLRHPGEKFFSSSPANPSPSAAPTSNPNEKGLGGTYTVQEGDTLWKIAEKIYDDGFKWRLLAEANNIPLERPLVEPGTVLKIPEVNNSELGSALPSPTPPTIYKVQPGDSLWKIAERFLGSGWKWKELARVNQIPLNNPRLAVGQELIVSGFGGPETNAQGDVLSAITSEKKAGGEETTTETYTVKRGDTLWDIAVRFYGNGQKWRLIFNDPRNNLSLYTAPNGRTYPLIHAGNVLILP